MSTDSFEINEDDIEKAIDEFGNLRLIKFVIPIVT